MSFNTNESYLIVVKEKVWNPKLRKYVLGDKELCRVWFEDDTVFVEYNNHRNWAPFNVHTSELGNVSLRSKNFRLDFRYSQSRLWDFLEPDNDSPSGRRRVVYGHDVLRHLAGMHLEKKPATID